MAGPPRRGASLGGDDVARRRSRCGADDETAGTDLDYVGLARFAIKWLLITLVLCAIVLALKAALA